MHYMVVYVVKQFLSCKTTTTTTTTLNYSMWENILAHWLVTILGSRYDPIPDHLRTAHTHTQTHTYMHTHIQMHGFSSSNRL